MIHQNNFAALRIFAALCVVLSHSWSLTGIHPELLVRLSNGHLNGGTLGVLMFFAMSGFLVTESMLRTQSTGAFLEARMLRLFPALAACLLFGIVLGGVVTTLPSAEYWSSPQTWFYFTKNMLLDTQFQLPGAFATVPFPNVVNGSLWTLPAEWTMYCMIAVLGLIGVMGSREATSAVVVAGIAALYVAPELARKLPLSIGPDLAVSMQAFMVGMLFQLNKTRVKWSVIWVVLLWALAVLKAHQPGLGPFVVVLAIAYTTLWFALAAPVKLYKADAWGDPSYGLYVYAFPIQQSLAYAYPGLGVLRMALLSVALSMLLAYASWWVIEKPALDRKGRLFFRRRSAPSVARSTPAVAVESPSNF